MIPTRNFRILTVLILSLSIFITSCKDSEKPSNPDDNTPENPNVIINNWIQVNMDYWYYWHASMNNPINEESDPEEYFNELLVNQDRFSIIYPNFQELLSALEGTSKEAGYEYTLFRESEANNNVIAVVLYVKKGSPAEAAGIKRDDVIVGINDTQITLNNYQDLLGATEETHTLNMYRYDDGEETYLPIEDPVEVSTTIFSENPLFMDSVYTIGDKKIGYLVYNFFAPGDNTEYNQELDEVFSDFKAKGINEFVLDLRYNGGGYVSSAVNLASLIAPNATENDIFSKTEYNSNVQPDYIELYGEASLTNRFKSKSQNIGSLLGSNTIYVIATGSTASSSELIINGLKPFLNVVIVGETTYGKNVGSIPIEDEENEDNDYGMLPIVSKSFNSQNQSEYGEGFSPNIPINEFAYRLLPFGDTNEVLLKGVIEQITGISSGDRLKTLDRKVLDNSLKTKARFGKMIESPIKLQK
ncbi:S41 family peptidase [Echinicola salinicaeni]|uniref:S41 family peptidase n=1 Tax=Echinicola salinicaeni TaxID=2762757 RepID=UPI0016453824|nr:S41 family peptidase [Echinicola salinicaeni]